MKNVTLFIKHTYCRIPHRRAATKVIFPSRNRRESARADFFLALFRARRHVDVSHGAKGQKRGGDNKP